jgi:hypothetical protein
MALRGLPPRAFGALNRFGPGGETSPKAENRMLSDVATAVHLHSARVKEDWLDLLSGNPASRSLADFEPISRLQDATLAEFQHLLRTTSFPTWVRMHEPHTHILRTIGYCGFVFALTYFVAGERAVFEGAASAKWNRFPGVGEARSRWRFFAQREMDTQCADCKKICALVQYSADQYLLPSDAPSACDLSGTD